MQVLQKKKKEKKYVIVCSLFKYILSDTVLAAGLFKLNLVIVAHFLSFLITRTKSINILLLEGVKLLEA